MNFKYDTVPIEGEDIALLVNEKFREKIVSVEWFLTEPISDLLQNYPGSYNSFQTVLKCYQDIEIIDESEYNLFKFANKYMSDRKIKIRRVTQAKGGPVSGARITVPSNSRNRLLFCQIN